jgi:hypothetical protein
MNVLKNAIMTRNNDAETGHMIAVMDVELYGRIREVSLVYVTGSDVVKLLTIHPLKDGQKAARVASGRWRRV